MPSFIEKLNIAGTKIVSVHPENSENNLSSVMALIVLNNPVTGKPLTVLDGTHITKMRTGAVGIATKWLSNLDSKTFEFILLLQGGLYDGNTES
jgi:ornithine cyclodeaminase/alanine dehydrogenase-like protein (mu-crystallin family)